LFVALTLAAAVWSIIHLQPDSPSVSAIRALAGFPLVGWFFADTIWLPLVLLTGQIVFWLAAARTWSAAVNRLEQWESG
jgi:hypothetical protein